MSRRWRVTVRVTSYELRIGEQKDRVKKKLKGFNLTCTFPFNPYNPKNRGSGYFLFFTTALLEEEEYL